MIKIHKNRTIPRLFLKLIATDFIYGVFAKRVDNCLCLEIVFDVWDFAVFGLVFVANTKPHTGFDNPC